MEKWGGPFFYPVAVAAAAASGGGEGEGGKILCDTGSRKKGGETRQVSDGTFFGVGKRKSIQRGGRRREIVIHTLLQGERKNFCAFPHSGKKKFLSPFFTFPYAPHAHFPLVIFPNLIDIVRIIWTVVGACMCSRNPRNHHATATMT